MSWEYFAESFTDSIIEGRRADEQRENDLFKIKAQRFLNNESRYTSKKDADQKFIEQAKSIVQSEPLAPKGSEFSIYQELKKGLSPEEVLDSIRRSGADAFESIPKPPTNTGGIVPVEEQTDDMLGVGTTVFNPDSDTSLEGRENPLETLSTPTENVADTRPELTDDDRKLMEMVGLDDEDYFRQIQGGYTAGAGLTQNYIFTPKAKQKEFNNAKDLAFDSFRQTLGDDMTPQEIIAASRQFEIDWKTESEKPSSTYTTSNFNQDMISYTKMLASENPEEKAKAENWWKNEYPAIKAILEATSGIGKTNDPANSMFIVYKDEEGNTTNGSGVRGSDGSVELDTGAVIKPENVVVVQTMDMAEEARASMKAISTPLEDFRKQKTSSLVGVEMLYNLDNIVQKNEKVLTTLAGKGSSMFDSFRKEMLSMGELLFELQSENPEEANEESLLNALNAEIQEKVNGGFFGDKMPQEVAEVYKEFNAALVRSVFATGRALGQQGNGFSNQDYNNIMKSLKNSNSYSSFSTNLRNFANEMYTRWDSNSKTLKQSPLVGKARQYVTNRELVDIGTMGVEDYYSTADESDKSIYDWARGKAPSANAQRKTITATEEDVRQGMSPDLVGKRVIRTIEPDENGTLSVTYKEAN